MPSVSHALRDWNLLSDVGSIITAVHKTGVEFSGPLSQLLQKACELDNQRTNELIGMQETVSFELTKGK